MGSRQTFTTRDAVHGNRLMATGQILAMTLASDISSASRGVVSRPLQKLDRPVQRDLRRANKRSLGYAGVTLKAWSGTWFLAVHQAECADASAIGRNCCLTDTK
jgi:hypothetical protein